MDKIELNLAELRKAWFGTHEINYALELLKDKKFCEFAYNLHARFNPKQRYEMACIAIEQIEDGKVKTEEEATEHEQLITACLFSESLVKELENQSASESKKQNVNYNYNYKKPKTIEKIESESDLER